MTRATTTHTKTLRRAHPAVLRAALRSHNRNDTESGRVAAQQRGTHWPTPCGYNRLIEVHDASNAIIATYRYDPFGRRLSKTLNTTGQSRSTYYFYSAEGLIAEADANGQITQSYGYAPGSTFSTNPLWTKLSTAGTATYYTYQNDHLGTPQKLLNQSGLTVWSATYDAFGRATIDPASTITNNLRFPGQYADQETGLHYNWMRFYDPLTGRYVTSDPIGLLGGENFYVYVGGNPFGNIDPIGLASKTKASDVPMVVPPILITDRDGGTTYYFDPVSGESKQIETSNNVDSKSKTGAAGPYTGWVTYCETGKLGKAYRTAKIRTTDDRYRWVHGGGSSLDDPYAPNQRLTPTFGCTRAHNKDVEDLCAIIKKWQKAHPKQRIPYVRY